MSFSDTYRHEVYLSRKDRSRRALFWAKVISFVLMVTIGATLRAEPELRRVLMDAGMDAVTSFANLNKPDTAGTVSASAARDVSWGQNDDPTLAAPRVPVSGVKVNRFGSATAAHETGQSLPAITPGR